MSDRLVFGHMHEDHSAELSRVAHLPVNRALVIASGGDLAFALAGAGVDVLAVDSNSAQINLVSEKMADPANALPLCFGGRVDRVLRLAGPVVAWLMDWPRLRPGRVRISLTNTLEAFLVKTVTLIHGHAAGRKLDRPAVRLLRTRLEQAMRHPDAATNPLLQVLLGKRFGSGLPNVWSTRGIDQWSTASGRIELRTAEIGEILSKTLPGTFGLISVSNLPDTMDCTAWGTVMNLAAAALKPGGYLIVRSMLQENIVSHADLFFDREAVAVVDTSPLCPVVWIGKRNATPEL